MYNAVKKIIDLGDGRSIEIETGKLAKQADGSVVVKMGKTMLLAAVTAAKDAKPDVDFMPLSVEYKEKYYAAGISNGSSCISLLIPVSDGDCWKSFDGRYLSTSFCQLTKKNPGRMT